MAPRLMEADFPRIDSDDAVTLETSADCPARAPPRA
jgi:hypothetical protein